MTRKRKARHEPHVRLYRHELESPAYRSLSPEARALLVELRALFNGAGNRIHMSVREIQERLSISQRPAQRARDELLDRGFIRVLAPADFRTKVRHAPVYALTSEPVEAGGSPPRDYMRWRP